MSFDDALTSASANWNLSSYANASDSKSACEKEWRKYPENIIQKLLSSVKNTLMTKSDLT